MDAFLASVAQLNDADQRAFLYSDLERQKLDNPEGYAEAVGFWAQLLVRACQRGLLSSLPAHAGDLPSVLTVDRRRLAQRLAFRGDTPMGLDAMLAELQGNGSLCAANDFFAPPALLQRWARWVAQRLLQPQPQTQQQQQQPLLVATAAVREAAARVVEAHRARAAACPLADIMSVDEFRRAYANALSTGSTPPDDAAMSPVDTAMSLVDAHVLIRHLVDHRLAATSAQLSATAEQPQPSTARAALVKFAPPSFSSSSSLQQQSPLAVTETDYATYQVMCTHRALSAQVAALETRIADLDAEARQALRRQQRPVAAARLRLKHHIETSILTKRIAALETVDRVVLQLQQTSSDIQLVQTLSAGTVALRALNDAARDVDPDRVADAWEEEAMRAAELEDALADTQAAVVTTMMMPADGVDVDVEAELDALIAMEMPPLSSPPPVVVESGTAEDSVDALLAERMQNVDIAAEDTAADTTTTTAAAENEEPKIAIIAE
ncbi:hypothetical protein GGF42_007376 [Coemansia sp. RSA 2424]|nr:hypothetical protein GGF42_007376 [Coemansia sp. RSA 2424]